MITSRRYLMATAAPVETRGIFGFHLVWEVEGAGSPSCCPCADSEKLLPARSTPLDVTSMPPFGFAWSMAESGTPPMRHSDTCTGEREERSSA